ncbi:NAD(P)H-binding protein [Mumia zhuanghuii]|uniref:SDR family oxidoreductase n=2 Tax=Mumia TaxID=1546255 RepID=A0ABW1QHP3_9ACTN|nr:MULTISPECIES: NAD(P)H-binding protein [Mumia]KAA1424712.1 NAD(P)H-binding protein [Mumia zhuanghuii]
MRIAVAGGTGTLGSAASAALEDRGHEVRALSRHSDFPVDLSTGEGLAAALEGCDVVVDCSNGSSLKQAEAVLVDGSRRLLEAEVAAGVGHHLAISIVGCDKVPGFGYYRAKVAQEAVVKAGSVPWTILRATQFHPFVDGLFAGAAKAGVRPSLAVPVQPVDVRDVAATIADLVASETHEAAGGGRTLNLVGPEVMTLRDLGRVRRTVTGRGRVPLRIPLWGGALRAARDGALVDESADLRGARSYEAWLKESVHA